MDEPRLSTLADHRFGKAVEVVLAHEGGLVDHPSDPGGITNMGISLAFAVAESKRHGVDLDVDHDGDVDGDDVRSLPRELAVEAYRRCFWERYGYDRIIDLVIATKVFDMSVNMGGTQAHRLVQRALAACEEPVTVDGVLGPQSIAAINDCETRELLLEVCDEQRKFYQRLVEKNPKLAVFASGWARRSGWPFTEKNAYTADWRLA